MSRCACGTGTCSCVIKGAPDGGITVVGNGSASRPYLLSVPGGNPLLNLDVVDSPTLDLTISGAGTPTDKRKITGQATQSLTNLKDVVGTPVEGEIPVWRTNHWEFEAAAAAGVPVSGSWGTPPLDVYGMDSLQGQPIYLDVNSQLRARPIQSEMGPGVDLNTVVTSGKWTQSQNAEATLLLNYPVPYAGLLEVSSVTTGNAMTWQRYTVYSAAAGGGSAVFERGLYLSTWSAWKQIGPFFSGTGVASSSNFAPGSAQTDIPGMAVTVPVIRPESVFLVHLNLDVSVATASGGNFISALLVPGGGSDSTKQIILNGTTDSPAGFRIALSQHYRITGLGASPATVFKATAAGTTFRVQSAHSALTVVQIA